MNIRIWCVEIMLILALSSCTSGDQRPVAHIPVQNLLADASFYPPEWEKSAGSLFSDVTDDADDKIQIGYHSIQDPTSVSLHRIVWYESLDDATMRFDSLAKHTKELFGESSLLSYIQYASPVAQRTEVLCFKITPGSKILCVVFAQYGKYISDFSAHFTATTMSKGNLLHGIEEIDTKITHVLRQ